ncbi:hypothetical protein BT63DRAFT_270853 [Microthyrium microscopicum]|uniref:Uncharacterized protein n=1 Tax=Microthyrium microscopicum TaxID=703497 RepID=A0A6A6U8C4_9PEZI|nr:hypothetical protein BT63DRAFT_270853 [Microthyrium microscopicum]
MALRKCILWTAFALMIESTRILEFLTFTVVVSHTILSFLVSQRRICNPENHVLTGKRAYALYTEERGRMKTPHLGNTIDEEEKIWDSTIKHKAVAKLTIHMIFTIKPSPHHHQHQPYDTFKTLFSSLPHFPPPEQQFWKSISPYTSHFYTAVPLNSPAQKTAAPKSKRGFHTPRTVPNISTSLQFPRCA